MPITSGDIDNFLKQRSSVQSSDVSNFLDNRNKAITNPSPSPAPVINPSQMGQTASQNYTQNMFNQGYQPMGEQAGSAFLEGQNKGLQFNLDLEKRDIDRQRDIQADLQKKVQSYAVDQGQGPVKTRMDRENLERIANLDEAFSALDNMDQHWNSASKEWNFGGPIKGQFSVPALSDNQKQYWESQSLAATSIANGVLPYTSGADAKAAVVKKMEIDSPNNLDTPQMARGKMVQLYQKAMNAAVTLRNEQSLANYDTSPLDDMIKRRGPQFQNYVEQYQKDFPQAQQHLQQPPQLNSGSGLSPQSNAILDRIAGKPQPSPISSFSPATQ